jgi:arylformamidase
MYDMKPVRISKRSSYVKFTDAMEQAMSTQRHLDKLRAGCRHPRHRRDAGVPAPEPRFCRRGEAAGKPAELVVAQHYNHFEMGESIANPYGPNGRAALAMMKLA